MTDFAHARRQMVDNQLRTSGITDRRLLAAMDEVPREMFVQGSRQALAYSDGTHPISATRRLGAPAPFAKLVQLAAIRHDEHVLDVGAGNGYSAAVLARLAAHVVAVEADPALAAQAREKLAGLAAGNVEVVDGSIESAGAAKGPYDVIVIEGTVSAVPEALFAQLKPEGRLVALVSENGRVAVARLYARSHNGLAATAAFDAKLPPLAPATDPGFVF